jgi:hypothetical protein
VCTFEYVHVLVRDVFGLLCFAYPAFIHLRCRADTSTHSLITCMPMYQWMM